MNMQDHALILAIRGGSLADLTKALADVSDDQIDAIVSADSDPEMIGWTALLEAVDRSRPDMVKTLIRRGADPCLRNRPSVSFIGRVSPLELSALRGDMPCLSELLSSTKKLKRKMLNEAFICSIERGREGLSDLLLKNGADVNYQAKDTRATPLHRASDCGSEQLVKALIDLGANVNAIDAGKSTPLMGACAFDFTQLAIFLVQSGAEVNPQGVDMPPLHIAIRRENSELFHFFLNAGANPHLKDSDGITAIELAKDRNWIEAIETLGMGIQ